VAVVSRSVSPGSGEILVVDDDASTRELVARQLRHAGFTAAEARDGDDALLRARVTRPAMMVVDLVMPGCDGFELIRRLRDEAISVPVVVLTGKTLSADEQQSLREGIAALVHKNGHSIESVVEEAKRLLLEHRKVKELRLPRVLYVEDSAQ